MANAVEDCVSEMMEEKVLMLMLMMMMTEMD